MTAPPLRWLAASGAIGAVLGLALGWQLWRPQAVTETPAPAVEQADGSRILERAPDPAARPTHQVPRGATVERVVRLAVVPEKAPIVSPTPGSVSRATPDSGVVAVAPPPDTGCRCAPVEVELSVIRLGDGSRRVVASVTGGRLLEAVDIPVEHAAPAKVLRWSAGVEWDLNARAWGGTIARDFDRLAFLPLPLEVGASLTPGSVNGPPRVGLRLALRF